MVLHKFGHIGVARALGIQTSEITLLAMGGLAKLNSLQGPHQELANSITGPAADPVLFTARVLLPGVELDWKVVALLGLKAGQSDRATPMFNLMVVLFDLLPAFPIDDRAQQTRRVGCPQRSRSPKKQSS